MPSAGSQLLVSAGLHVDSPPKTLNSKTVVHFTARHLFREELKAQPAGSFASIVISSIGPAVLDQTALTAAVAALQPGGTVEIIEVTWLSSPTTASKAPRVHALRDSAGLQKAMLFSGLSPASGEGAVEEQPIASAGVAASQLVASLYPELASSAAKGSGEAADALSALAVALLPQLSVCTVRATKPAYQAGASFSLRSRRPIAMPKAPAIAAEAAAPAALPVVPNPWAALGPLASGPGGGAVDLVAEDDLLEEEDRAKKLAQQMDCGTDNGAGKRKACKNCSCGLKEMLEMEDGTQVEVPTQKSSCGNCSLGDAYRCANCPHLGKPAFAPGDELKLTNAADPALAPPLADGGKPVVAGYTPGGVVKLSLDAMDDF